MGAVQLLGQSSQWGGTLYQLASYRWGEGEGGAEVEEIEVAIPLRIGHVAALVRSRMNGLSTIEQTTETMPLALKQ